jgi:uncharacterized protein (TIGR00251 family)
MIVAVRAKPGVKKGYIKRLDAKSFEVAVSEPPVKGRANAAIIKALALHFNIPSYQISIISGQASRLKKIKIPLTASSKNFES